MLSPQSLHPRSLAVDFVAFTGASALAWSLLWYLHGTPQQAWQSLACGALGGVVVRRWLRATYAEFPDFLARIFGTGIVLVATALSVLGTLGLGPRPLSYLAPRWDEVAGLVLFAALAGVGLAALAWTHGRYGREVSEARAREAAMQEEALRARLRALQAQINPHFLFNAFNSLAELVHEDSDRAEGLVEDLAHLMRYSLRSSTEARVPLAQELEATERYLRVEHARLGERLLVEREIAPGLGDAPVPGLVLQPLVENAVRHAVAPRPEGGRIRIRIAADGEQFVRVAVEDDGPGLPEDVLKNLLDPAASDGAPRGTGGAGGGLANVARRLELVYRGAATLEAGRGELGGTLLEVRLPRLELDSRP
jgi:signal transduction histidine kinase